MDKKVRTVDYKCACLSCEVLEDGCTVDSCCCPNSAMAGGPHLEMSVYPSHWELETCPSGPGDRLRFDLGILPSFTSSLCACVCVGAWVEYIGLVTRPVMVGILQGHTLQTACHKYIFAP